MLRTASLSCATTLTALHRSFIIVRHLHTKDPIKHFVRHQYEGKHLLVGIKLSPRFAIVYAIKPSHGERSQRDLVKPYEKINALAQLHGADERDDCHRRILPKVELRINHALRLLCKDHFAKLCLISRHARLCERNRKRHDQSHDDQDHLFHFYRLLNRRLNQERFFGSAGGSSGNVYTTTWTDDGFTSAYCSAVFFSPNRSRISGISFWSSSSSPGLSSLAYSCALGAFGSSFASSFSSCFGLRP